MLKAIQYGIGGSLILLGIAGLFLPVLQGLILITLGVFILRGGSVKKTWQYVKGNFKKGYKKNR